MKKIMLPLMFALSLGLGACAHHGGMGCCKDGECKMSGKDSCCKDGECKMDHKDEKKEETKK
jgi:hypothetical protein